MNGYGIDIWISINILLAVQQDARESFFENDDSNMHIHCNMACHSIYPFKK